MLDVTKAFFIGAFILLVASNASAAPTRDHLQCFKIKDNAAKAAYSADLTTANPVIPALESGCTISVPAKLYCIDVSKGNVSPPPPGAAEGGAAQTYLCYKAKCNKLAATTDATDQFGPHSLEIKSTSLVCAPVGTGAACGAGDTNCNNVCVNLETDEDNCGACGTVCDDTQICAIGVCTCPMGEVGCSGTCTNTATDSLNCGACGTVCGGTTPACCNSACADLSSDPFNCGTCGDICPGGAPTCTGGVCGP
ncbi:MAG TPA: hypothetical protein VGK20_17935 [Candidatus Binatia bacterium]|jgi:hypothetical protein